MMRAGLSAWWARILAGVAGGAVGAGLLVAAAAPVQAAEVTVRPGDGVLKVAGHGYGHGRGMSQWGAYGAALKGLTYQQIMAFYYPGTTLGSLSNSPITVRVTSDTDGSTEVLAQDGLTASSGTRSLVLPASSSIVRWRVLSAGGYRLQWLSSSGTWSDYDLMGAKAPIPGPVTFSRPAGSVRLLLPAGYYREYLGSVTGASYGGIHYSVVRTTMETYLRGVVPNEMPASWAPEALKAQAVAARTYAANQRATASSSRPYQTCDSTACQVFDGYADYTLAGALKTRHTDSRSDAAIAATVTSSKVPVVVLYHGSLAFTEFSASNGGYSTAGSVPYLVAKSDPYDGAAGGSAHSWYDTVSVASIEQRHPSIGRLVALRVTRDGRGEWGGRVDSVALVGTNGTVNLSGSGFSSEAGFLHRWWAVRYADPHRDFTMDGRDDLIARVASTGQLRVYPGLPGRLSYGRAIGSGWGGMSVVQGSGDFTGDGLADVVAVERSTGKLWLYPGTGDGRLGTRRLMGSGWGWLRNVTVAGDMSGDGLPDIVGVVSDGRLLLYTGNGAGGLSSRRTMSTGWSSFDRLVGIGDMNGDGHPDLLGRIRTTGQLAVYHSTGTGYLRSDRVVTGGGWNSMSLLAAAGDLDEDGRPDLFAVDGATGALYAYNGASGRFDSRTQISTGWAGIDALG